MTEKTDIRQRLWKSMDMRCIRWKILSCFIAAGLSILTGHGELLLETVVAVACIVCGAFLVYFLWQGFQILRKPEGYTFCRAVLSQPQKKWPVKAMYFTVELEAPDGSKITKNTHAIFARHGVLEPLVESYVNKEVTIAYNEETQMVVVIG